MINLKSKREKRKWQHKLTKISIGYEILLSKRIKRILGRQYYDAARLLEWGIENINCSINEQSEREKKLFLIFSRKISDFFENVVYNLLAVVDAQNLSNKKQFKKIYSEKTIQWFTAYSAFIAEKVNRTTINRIKRYIDKRKEEGASLRLIARELRKIDRRKRSISIARTMVHTIIMYSIESAMEVSNMDYIAEWIGSNKEHRKKYKHKMANGERVRKGNMFVKTGEELHFPGDPSGSIANIAGCRCILCYYINSFAA